MCRLLAAELPQEGPGRARAQACRLRACERAMTVMTLMTGRTVALFVFSGAHAFPLFPPRGDRRWWSPGCAQSSLDGTGPVGLFVEFANPQDSAGV